MATVLNEHLGADATNLSVVTHSVPVFRMADYDIAWEVLVVTDPQQRLIGLGGGVQRHLHDLADLIVDTHLGATIGEPSYANVPIGPHAERACVS